MASLFIFLGAGMGGVLRYWVSNLAYLFLGKHFPYGTLVVNISGCFMMGFFSILLLEYLNHTTPALRSFLLIGIFGGYTTFSAFSFETLKLVESGAWLSALLNVLLSISLCLIAVWLGVNLGRRL